MKQLAFALLCVSSLSAQQRKLTAIDKVLLTSSTAMLVGDWSTSLDLVRHHITETNPVLGPHPTEGRVNLVCGLTVLGNLALSRFDKGNRRIFWTAITIIEAVSVKQNRRLGMRFVLP